MIPGQVSLHMRLAERHLYNILQVKAAIGSLRFEGIEKYGLLLDGGASRLHGREACEMENLGAAMSRGVYLACGKDVNQRRLERKQIFSLERGCSDGSLLANSLIPLSSLYLCS